jgi:hypothetical protein
MKENPISLSKYRGNYICWLQGLFRQLIQFIF